MNNNIGSAVQAGILFGPNDHGKTYLSIFLHRGIRPNKNKWSSNITPPIEYSIFCPSDYANYNDNSGHYWGFLNRGDLRIGLRGERLCKFPLPSNIIDPWHGYPVSPMNDGDYNAPPDYLVQRWPQTGDISRTFARRIQKRKI
jgi:hypothetical protein